ncbi:tetratricopeptide repeat protein [Patescibacteria group bacterium]|nr:tetratricopeptide repeat protein [Patescibacteria group bacterium]
MNKKILRRIIFLFISALILMVIIFLVYNYFLKTEPVYQPKEDLTAEQIAELNERKAQNLKTLKEFPDYYEIYLDLGNIERRLGDYEQAIKHYKKSSEIIPSSSIPYLNTAAVYEDMEDYDKAYEAYWQAQEVSPSYYLVYQKIVDFYRWYYPQKVDDIETVYKLGIEKASNKKGLIRSLATYYFNNERYEESLPFWEQSVEKNPDDQYSKDKLEETKNILGL